MSFHPNDLSELDELTEEHLGFSALSDGLGFSRTAKKPGAKSLDEITALSDDELRQKAFSGTGAVAAGPARPVFPAPLSSARPTAQPARSVAPAANILATPAASRSHRAAAFLVDFTLISLPLVFAWWFSFGEQSWELFRNDPRPPLLLFGVIFGAYFLLSESFGGQSIGKMLFHLRVVEDDKYQKPTGLNHAAARLALAVAGILCFGLGLIASFWDAKRRPWHDRYSGSIVRRKA